MAIAARSLDQVVKVSDLHPSTVKSSHAVGPAALIFRFTVCSIFPNNVSQKAIDNIVESLTDDEVDLVLTYHWNYNGAGEIVNGVHQRPHDRSGFFLLLDGHYESALRPLKPLQVLLLAEKNQK